MTTISLPVQEQKYQTKQEEEIQQVQLTNKELTYYKSLYCGPSTRLLSGYKDSAKGGNTKIRKSFGHKNYVAAIMHLSPHKGNDTGVNMCRFATQGCSKACLNTAGYGRYSYVQNARINKTKWFIEHPQSFLCQLDKELGLFVKWCKNNRYKPAVRLNGTSDVRWEVISPWLLKKYGDIQFYDYTKYPFAQRPVPRNYDLTFSRAESLSNQKEAMRILAAGGRVAMVFDKLPNEWLGYKVIDGDKHDFRFLDGKNVITGLVPKGKGKKDKTGFVIQTGDQ